LNGNVPIWILLADDPGLTVITERMGAITELNFLRENNRTTFQGYYFNRPMPPADFRDRLKSGILALETPDCDDTPMMKTIP
jgi:EAL domain-containing protein (putative c-di-GMP-specific phosphodiesterase class I)